MLKRRSYINKPTILYTPILSPKKAFFFIILLYFCQLVPVCHAEERLISPIPTDELKNDPNNSNDINIRWQESFFKAQVKWLKQKKAKYIRENRIQHIKNTETLYKKAVWLYRHNKLVPAQETFRQVEYLTRNYKSTRKFLRIIEKKLQ